MPLLFAEDTPSQAAEAIVLVGLRPLSIPAEPEATRPTQTTPPPSPTNPREVEGPSLV